MHMFLLSNRLHLEPKLKTGSHREEKSAEIRLGDRTISVGNISSKEFVRKVATNSDPAFEAKDDSNASLLVLNLSYKADTSRDDLRRACCSSNASLASDEF